jgi:predicted CoA-binding protein
MTMLATKVQAKVGAGKMVIDPAHDLLREEGHPLEPIFSPKNVAVIGATERQGSVGRTVLWNLLSSPFGGTVYPINNNRPSVLGIRAYKDIRELPEKPDLIVVSTAKPARNWSARSRKSSAARCASSAPTVWE